MKTIIDPELPTYPITIRPAERTRLVVRTQRSQDGWYGYTISYAHNGYLVRASLYSYDSHNMALDAGARAVTKMMSW